MEGPSLFLAAEQLSPFVGKTIRKVSGNTKIQKERLIGKKIHSIFSYGKYLFFQFDTFALRTHFLLMGTFEATIEGEKITGDYPKRERTPRLAMELENGHIETYNCSVVFIEESAAIETCDFSIDIMSSKWNEKKALVKLKKSLDKEIGDVLLDQEIFKGVGNIIKNEVLLLAKVPPYKIVKELSTKKIEEITRMTREYVFQFYKWRKNFVLRKHFKIYRQSICKVCGSKVTRMKTGENKRMSYICPSCQESKS